MSPFERLDVVELMADHGRLRAGTTGVVLEPPQDGGVVVEVFGSGGYTVDVATLPVDRLRLIKRPER